MLVTGMAFAIFVVVVDHIHGQRADVRHGSKEEITHIVDDVCCQDNCEQSFAG